MERFDLIDASNKLILEITESFEEDNISEKLKKMLFDYSNTVSKHFNKEKIIVKRLYDALCITSKFENE